MLVLLVFESLAFCDKVVNGEVVPLRVPGVMLLLSFSRDGKETLFGIDDDIMFVVLCWGWSTAISQRLSYF